MSIRGNTVITIRKNLSTLGTERNLKQFEVVEKKAHTHGHSTFRPATLAVRCGSGLCRLRLSFADGHSVRRQRLRFASGIDKTATRGASLAGKCRLSPSGRALLCIRCR